MSKAKTDDPKEAPPAPEPEVTHEDLLGLDSVSEPQPDEESEAPPEPKREAPTPDAQEPEPEPEVDERPPDPDSDAPEETVESLRAKLAEVESARERERLGFVRDIAGLRRQRDPAQPQRGPQPASEPVPAAAPTAAGVEAKIVTDDQGNVRAVIDPSAINALLQQSQPQPDPVDSLQQGYQHWRMQTVMGDPVTLGPALSRIDAAFDFLNARTIAKQAEIGLAGFASFDQAIDFLDKSGVVKEASDVYPDVLPDLRAAVELVEARNTLSSWKLRGVVDGYLGRKEAKAQPASESKPASAASKPVRELPDKPRSQSSRGRQPVESRGGRLDEIGGKDILDRLTPEERIERDQLMRQLAEDEGAAA